jgi:tetratricopeptide (TPR) repeat protein
MEQYEKARATLAEALRLRPDYADAINLLGFAYFRLKQYSEATAQFQQAIRLAPDNTVAHYNLGKTYFLMGRKEEAQQIYRKLLTLDKEMAEKLLDEIKKMK